MEGIFKAWVAGKPFGFIVSNDGPPDVMVHETAESRALVTPGARVSFDIDEFDEGWKRRAQNLKLLNGSESEGSIEG